MSPEQLMKAVGLNVISSLEALVSEKKLPVTTKIVIFVIEQLPQDTVLFENHIPSIVELLTTFVIVQLSNALMDDPA